LDHVVLLGDSIFDNARYVPGGPSVIEHLRRGLPSGWRATLLAVDGLGAEQVERQLARLPADATHLVVSAGGNNALDHSSLILHEPATSFAQVLRTLAEIRGEFQVVYRRMLQTVLAQRRPTAVCTVYDRIPGLDAAETAGLCLFNDVIFREAFRVGVPVIDLRLVCAEASDYAKTSPIEPSVVGGGKVAKAIVRLVTAAGSPPEGSRIII
jgi:GDSL-like lipase/acylhydrolase family protein